MEYWSNEYLNLQLTFVFAFPVLECSTIPLLHFFDRFYLIHIFDPFVAVVIFSNDS